MDLDGNLTVNDAAGFHQALTNASGYAASLGVSTSVLNNDLGDYNLDGTFNREDARTWADTLSLGTRPGLGGRAAGFVALDQGDTGDGNFFNTVMACGDYTTGDSAGDLAGGNVFSAPNGVIDASDIDLVALVAQGVLVDPLTGGQFGVTDLDGSGLTDGDDVVFLVTNILDSFQGDFNLDCQVDLLDLDILGQNWQQSGTLWSTGDANGDGATDLLDLDLLGQNWQNGAGLDFEAALAASGITIPEPASMALLAVGWMVVVRRRR